MWPEAFKLGEDLRLQWVLRQNLGAALSSLGEITANPVILNEAVQELTRLSRELERARIPGYWAMAQNNLGLTLTKLGEVTRDPTHVDQAVEAFNRTLALYNKDLDPRDWAATMNNLAGALALSGMLRRDAKQLHEAANVFAQAVEVYAQVGDDYAVQRARENLHRVVSERRKLNQMLDSSPRIRARPKA